MIANIFEPWPSRVPGDDEHAAVMEVARPILPRDRDGFLHAVAAELARYPEVGPGIIGCVVGRLQRQHLNAPRRGNHVGSKWGH